MDEKLKKDYISTIGVDVTTLKVSVNKELVTLTVWDLAGQNQFQNIRKSFYLGASVALLIFDVTNKDSFNNLTDWIEEASENITSRIPFVLVGNKIDLPNREITDDQMEQFLLANKGIVNSFETSALTGENIKDLFRYCAELIHIQEVKPSKVVKKSTKKAPKSSSKKTSSKKSSSNKKTSKKASKDSKKKKAESKKPSSKKKTTKKRRKK